MMLAAADALSARSFGGVPIASYEDLMGLTLGTRGRALSSVGILLLQLGCLVGYANILADVVSPFAIDVLPPGLEPNRGAVLTAVTLGGMLPVGLVVGGENPSLLAAVSQFSLAIVATFGVVMSVHAFYPEHRPGPTGALPAGPFTSLIITHIYPPIVTHDHPYSPTHRLSRESKDEAPKKLSRFYRLSWQQSRI